MSDANSLVMLQARVEELQTRVNTLETEKQALLARFQAVVGIATLYVPQEKQGGMIEIIESIMKYHS